MHQVGAKERAGLMESFKELFDGTDSSNEDISPPALGEVEVALIQYNRQLRELRARKKKSGAAALRSEEEAELVSCIAMLEELKQHEREEKAALKRRATARKKFAQDKAQKRAQHTNVNSSGLFFRAAAATQARRALTGNTDN